MGAAAFLQKLRTGNGFEFLTTGFQLEGDFSISAQMSRDNLTGVGEAGLQVNFASRFADVWCYATDRIVANIFVPSVPGYGSAQIFTPASIFFWGIQRVGSTLTLTADYGSGVQVVRSATGANLTGPVTADLFLGQETGNTSSHTASSDNFSIQATSFVPEPTTFALLGVSSLLLAARRRNA